MITTKTEIQKILRSHNFDSTGTSMDFYFKSDHHGGQKSILVEFDNGRMEYMFRAQWIADDDGYTDSGLLRTLQEAIDFFE